MGDHKAAVATMRLKENSSMESMKPNPTWAPPINGSLNLAYAQQSSAIRSVTGMMYFADFDNPILQEAPWDLLLAGHETKGFKAFGALLSTRLSKSHKY
jgi:hypothetical protein